MISTITTLWPIIKWVLQALGFLGPEDVAAEREFRLRLLAAEQENEAALRRSFAEFQRLWRPSTDRVYVWANTIIALFQPTILALVYWDVFAGPQKSVQVAERLSSSLGGLFVFSILLFPFYGPALVSGVAEAFQSAVDVVVKRGSKAPRQRLSISTPPNEPEAPQTYRNFVPLPETPRPERGLEAPKPDSEPAKVSPQPPEWEPEPRDGKFNP